MQIAANDFDRYYTGSLILYPLGTDGSLRPLYIQSYIGPPDGTEHKVKGRWINKAGKLLTDRTVTLDPELITIDGAKFGYVDSLNGAVYIQRRPRRTARKGLFRDALDISAGDVFHTLETPKSVEVFWKLFNPEYRSYAKAWADVACANSPSAALSKNVAIARSQESPKIGVLYRRQEVGIAAADHVRLFPRFIHLDSEILSVVPDVRY